MTHLKLVMAGVVSTAAMTLFTEIVFSLLKRNYHVIRVLANMIRFDKVTPTHATPQPQMIIAGVVHYFIGIIFAFLYSSFIVWVPDWSPSIKALAFGVLIGLIAVGGWRLFFDLHPGPPAVSLPDYLSVIALGHFVLSFVLAGMYQ